MAIIVNFDYLNTIFSQSVIFYFSAQQAVAAEQSLETLQNSGQLQAPVVTEILPATQFYMAEEYHQRYFEKHGMSAGVCRTWPNGMG